MRRFWLTATTATTTKNENTISVFPAAAAVCENIVLSLLHTNVKSWTKKDVNQTEKQKKSNKHHRTKWQFNFWICSISTIPFYGMYNNSYLQKMFQEFPIPIGVCVSLCACVSRLNRE